MDSGTRYCISMPVKNITIEEFNNLELDDVNHSGILFAFDPAFTQDVCDKIINGWNLNKKYRVEQVKVDRMFFVENCDIQTVDDVNYMLCEMIKDTSVKNSCNTFKKVYVIGDMNEL